MKVTDIFKRLDRALRPNETLPEKAQPLADGQAVARCLWRYYGPGTYTIIEAAIGELDLLCAKEQGTGEDPYPGKTFEALIKEASEET